jgi:hypothetical protein
MGRQLTLRQKIEERIKNHVDDVFLPREFSDLSDEDQMLRALRNLVREGSLVKLGYGVYGRAVQSQLTGQAILYSQNGFAGAVRQALNKLGVKWEPTAAKLDYNAGKSTQVLLNLVLRVKGRFSRQLSDGKSELILDR